MKSAVLTVGILVAAACREPEPVSVLEHPRSVPYHMGHQLDHLRRIEFRLLTGDLDEGRRLAHLLVEPWTPEAAPITALAERLTTAPTIADAVRLEAAIAVACSDCHRATQIPHLRPWPALPPPGATLEVEMRRHRWAIDRMWEGVIAPDDDAWTAGLAQLAASPALDDEARAGVRAARADRDRGRAFGAILVACSGCHVRLR